MKTPHIILAISLVINATTIGLMIVGPASIGAIIRPASSRSSPPTPEGLAAGDGRRSAATGEPGWSEFDFSDFAALRSAVTSRGFPEYIARAMIAAAVNHHFAERQRRLLPRPQLSGKFWINPAPLPPADLATREAMRDLDRERSKVLEELIGADFRMRDRDEESVAFRHRKYGDLSLSKISQLEKINSDYADLVARVRDGSLGVMLAADYEKLAMLDREKRRDIEQALTESELRDFDLRNSAASATLRRKLGHFAATEQEFLSLYDAQKSFDEHLSLRSGPMTSDMMQQRSTAERALEERFREILGAERYIDYQRANRPSLTADPSLFGASADTLGRITSRLNLAPGTVDKIVALQEAHCRRVNAIFSDPGLNPDQKQSQLMELGIEATKSYTNVLGGQGFEAYRNNGGRWIGELLRPFQSGG